MTLAPRDEQKHWTVEDYQHLDDDERYEILRGQLVMVPAPTASHQRAITVLGAIITTYVMSEELGVCFDAPFDVYLGEDTVVQPDFTFISSERRTEVLEERGAVAAPDLVVEVLSPGTMSRDRGVKRAIYADAGVPWLLLVDPAELTVEVYRRNDDGQYVWTDTASETDVLEIDLFPELSIDLAEIWPPERLEELAADDDSDVEDRQ